MATIRSPVIACFILKKIVKLSYEKAFLTSCKRIGFLLIIFKGAKLSFVSLL